MPICPPGTLTVLTSGARSPSVTEASFGDDLVPVGDHAQDRRLERRQADSLLADRQLTLGQSILAVELAHHLRVEHAREVDAGVGPVLLRDEVLDEVTVGRPLGESHPLAHLAHGVEPLEDLAEHFAGDVALGREGEPRRIECRNVGPLGKSSALAEFDRSREESDPIDEGGRRAAEDERHGPAQAVAQERGGLLVCGLRRRGDRALEASGVPGEVELGLGAPRIAPVDHEDVEARIEQRFHDASTRQKIEDGRAIDERVDEDDGRGRDRCHGARSLVAVEAQRSLAVHLSPGSPLCRRHGDHSLTSDTAHGERLSATRRFRREQVDSGGPRRRNGTFTAPRSARLRSYGRRTTRRSCPRPCAAPWDP